MTGYVQVYTGNGKGKTTAALGLALRAAGAGMRVYIAQFAKGMDCSEHNAIRRFSDLITLRQYGRDCFIRGEATEDDFARARRGFDELREVVTSGEFSMIILDEANIATHYRLFSVDELLDLIDSKPPHVELIITGRNADPRIMSRADLVTEMREVKHYYAAGVAARTGIEM